MKEYLQELKTDPTQSYSIHVQYSNESNNFFVDTHMHEFVEIEYGLCGKFNIMIDNSHYEFGEGDIAVVGSGQVHEITNSANKVGHYLVIKFEPSLISPSPMNNQISNYALPFMFNNLGKNHIFRSDTIPPDLKSALAQMAVEAEAKEYGYELALKKSLYQLLLYIVRTINFNHSKDDIISSKTFFKIRKVLNYIHSNSEKPIDVRRLAETAHLEYCYFSRMFKQLTQMTCTKYINTVRINKSVEYLLSSDISITDAAILSGFTNISYYIKQFKAIKKITPSKYRALYFSKDDNLRDEYELVKPKK